MSESSPGIGVPITSNNAAPDPVHSGGTRRNRRTGGNPKGNSQREGKCPFNKQGETFQKTTRKIAEYIGREFDEDREFRTGLVRVNLPRLIEPVPQDDPNENRLGFQMWTFEPARYKKESANRKRNEEKAYAIVLGQCSLVIRDIIEVHQQWSEVNNSSDGLGLLKLIQQTVVSKNTNKHKIHAYVDALHTFYAFCQENNMSHSKYLDEFKDLVEIVRQVVTLEEKGKW